MLWLVGALYETVWIPTEVARELTSYGVRIAPEPYLQVASPIGVPDAILALVRVDVVLGRQYEELQRGELDALSLSLEIGATRLLIDEKAGRFVARRCGLLAVGTLGVLGAAKKAGLIPQCGPVLRQIRRKAGAWFSEALIALFLEEMGE